MLLDKLLSSVFQSPVTFALISVMSRFATEYTDDFIYLVKINGFLKFGMLPASRALPISGEAVGVCFGSITKLSAVATSDNHVEKSCKFTLVGPSCATCCPQGNRSDGGSRVTSSVMRLGLFRWACAFTLLIVVTKFWTAAAKSSRSERRLSLIGGRAVTLATNARMMMSGLP